MDTTSFIHPAPQLARLNLRLLKLSICMSLIALAFSLSSLGFFSLWITPTVFLFSIAHNLTLLVLSYRERTGKRRLAIPGSSTQREMKRGRLPATSTRASFVCAFVLALMWAAAAGTTFALVIVTALEDGDFSTSNPGYYKVVPWFEAAFGLLEVVVLVPFGVGGVKERRAVLGVEDEQRWWSRFRLRVVRSDSEEDGAA